MHPDYQDRRRFQIAAVGSPTSDAVIYLPPEHRDFYRIKRILGDRRCYCGTLLGGCGGELVPTRGAGRVCFLRHLPGSQCSLHQLHEEAADHIFIARDLRALLKRHGIHTPKPMYEIPGLAIGAGVAIRYNQTDLIYAHLSNRSVTAWADIRESKTFGSMALELSGAAVSTNYIRFNDRGYTLRVECRTRGGDRSTYIGTQLKPDKIWWSRIGDCRIARGEIVTPFLKQRGGKLTPTDQALQEPPDRFDVLPEPDLPGIDPSLASFRRRYEMARDTEDLLELFLVREDLKKVRDQNSYILGLEKLWTAVQKAYRRATPSRWYYGTGFWGLVAKYISQRKQLQREALLKIYHQAADCYIDYDSRERRALEWIRNDLGVERSSQPVARSEVRLNAAELESAARATWALLKEAAANRESISWTVLNKRLEGRFNGVDPSQVVDVFLHIQQEILGTPTPVSALVTTSKGNRHPDFYDGVLYRLGVKPETIEESETRWRRDRQRLFRDFGKP